MAALWFVQILENPSSKMCITMDGTPDPKTRLVPKGCVPGAPVSQMFKFFDDKTIRPSVRPDLCVDLKDGVGVPGTPVHLMKCERFDTNQAWELDASTNYIRLKAKAGMGMVLWDAMRSVAIASLKGMSNQVFLPKERHQYVQLSRRCISIVLINTLLHYIVQQKDSHISRFTPNAVQTRAGWSSKRHKVGSFFQIVRNSSSFEVLSRSRRLFQIRQSEQLSRFLIRPTTNIRHWFIRRVITGVFLRKSV